MTTATAATTARWLIAPTRPDPDPQPLTGCPSGCHGVHVCGVGDPIPTPSPCVSGCLSLTLAERLADFKLGCRYENCRWYREET